MTVIEKLENNIAEVNASFQAIKSKIVENGVEVADELRPIEYAPKVDAVFEAGKKAEYDAFWDKYQQNGERTQYQYGFSGIGWNDETFKPKHNILMSNAVACFYYCFVTDLEARLQECGVILDSSVGTNFNNCFANSRLTIIPEVVFSAKVTYIGTVFANNNRLHTIRKVILQDGFNADMLSAFTNCNVLENVVFEGIIPKAINVQWCTKLTHDSLMSIINALKDYSGTDTWMTVTLGAENIAKLTSDELLIAEQKQWQIS